MNKNLVSKVGEIGQDNLIAKLTPAAETTGVVIASGSGAVKRGTVLGRNASGKYVPYGGENVASLTISCILADDVDATSADATGVAYRSGNFNPAAIIVATGYTLTAADLDNLRRFDIIFTQMI